MQQLKSPADLLEIHTIPEYQRLGLSQFFREFSWIRIVSLVSAFLSVFIGVVITQKEKPKKKLHLNLICCV